MIVFLKKHAFLVASKCIAVEEQVLKTSMLLYKNTCNQCFFHAYYSYRHRAEHFSTASSEDISYKNLAEQQAVCFKHFIFQQKHMSTKCDSTKYKHMTNIADNIGCKDFRGIRYNGLRVKGAMALRFKGLKF